MGDFFKNTLGFSARVVYGNAIADWAAAAFLTLAVWFGLSLLRRLLAARQKRFTTAGHPTAVRLLFYLLGRTKQFTFLTIAVSLGQEDLNFPDKVQHIIDNGVMMLMLTQIGLWAGGSLKFYLQIKETDRGTDRGFSGSLDIINFVGRLLIWSLVVLVALENLGVNITALLAGLGVGGVAVALALQNVLGDLFASLSIALDKPFAVGDMLTIDTFIGAVEHIGIKTTRLRSDSGEQIILSNADILKSRVRNFGRAPEQRAIAAIRVSYSTPTEKLTAIPKLLEGIVRDQPNARFDRCHLKSLGDSSLQFELTYFVQQPKINPLLDLQQAVNFRIIDEFRRLGIEFALPSQRVVLEKE